MLARYLMVMLAVLPFASPVEAGIVERIFGAKETLRTPTIKVLVADNQEGVVLEVKGRYKLFNPENGKHIDNRMAGKRKYIQALKDGLRWGEEFPGLHQLCVVPDSPETTVVVNGIEYRGAMFVYDVEGLISVVNELPLEDYVSSVLAPQYREPLPEEALAAVAIAARTTALYQSKHPKTAFWSVEAGQVGYQGIVVIQPSAPIQKALVATRHMVMSESSEPFLAGWDSGMYAEAGIRRSSLSLSQVEHLAQSGENAGRILTRAFPGATIQLIK